MTDKARTSPVSANLADRLAKAPVQPDWTAQLHPPEKRAEYDFVVLKVSEAERDMIVAALATPGLKKS